MSILIDLQMPMLAQTAKNVHKNHLEICNKNSSPFSAIFIQQAWNGFSYSSTSIILTLCRFDPQSQLWFSSSAFHHNQSLAKNYALLSAIKNRINRLQVNKQRYYKERCDFCFVFLNIILLLLRGFHLQAEKINPGESTSQNAAHELLVIQQVLICCPK